VTVFVTACRTQYRFCHVEVKIHPFQVVAENRQDIDFIDFNWLFLLL